MSDRHPSFLSLPGCVLLAAALAGLAGGCTTTSKDKVTSATPVEEVPAPSSVSEPAPQLERLQFSVPSPSPAPQPAPMPEAVAPLERQRIHVLPGRNAESYAPIAEADFTPVAAAPLSTFSIDVDTASYANVRRYLKNGQRPPKDAVRIEELLNYFRYDYPGPRDDAPFATHTEVATCPWKPDHYLASIGLKGREVHADQRPAANLVFLIDVSGSMNAPDKLPLVQQSLRLLADQLDARDRIAMVVYAAATGVALPSTRGDRKRSILAALDELRSGGSTNGGAGIQLAYDIARENYIEGGINRVMLATDGDFNVGITSQPDLLRLIEAKRQEGIFLTVLGFGTGNLKDSTLELLADKGNGAYAYIDSLREGRKVLVEQLSGTLQTIAKDVKIQVEFNPAKVASYRLIGYENRTLAAEDFNDDAKDAGEIGAGHTVTALYELVPVGVHTVDPLRYQPDTVVIEPARTPFDDELFNLKLRYKAPDGDVSARQEFPFRGAVRPFAESTADFKFACAVASFGTLLRESDHGGGATWKHVLAWAEEGRGNDEDGYRDEFLSLVKEARRAGS